MTAVPHAGAVSLSATTLPESVVGSLFVPPQSAPGVLFFAHALQSGVVNTTISDMPYAAVTDTRVSQAGPYVPELVCECGQRNPDSCVTTLQGTEPYLDAPLSHVMKNAAYDSSPSFAITPVQAYLQLRAAPLNL